WVLAWWSRNEEMRLYLTSTYPVGWNLAGARAVQGYRGLGQPTLSAAQVSQLASVSAQGIAAALRPAADAGQITAAVGSTVLGVGATITAVAPPVGVALVIAGALIDVAGAFMHFLGVGDGCGQSCIVASQYADQAQKLLDANIAAYFA